MYDSKIVYIVRQNPKVYDSKENALMLCEGMQENGGKSGQGSK